MPARATASGRRAVELASGEHDVARSPHRARDGAQRRRLARAVRAEQGDDLALSDGQRHTMQRDDLPVAGRDVVELEQRRHPRVSFSCMVEVEEGIRRVDLLAAVRPRPRPLLLPALVDRWVDPRRHRSRLPDARGALAPGARRAGWAGRADRRHAHASRPRGRSARRGRADWRAGAAGSGGLRAVRPRLGRARPAAVRRLLDLTRDARGPGRDDAARVGGAPRCRALGAGSAAARGRRRPRRLAGRGAARPRRRPHRAAPRRRDDRRRHDPRRGSRPRSASIPAHGPIRSPTTSRRSSGSRRSTRASRTPGTRTW